MEIQHVLLVVNFIPMLFALILVCGTGKNWKNFVNPSDDLWFFYSIKRTVERGMACRFGTV